MLFQMLTRFFLTKDPYKTELCTKGTLKRAIATTEARNAIETPASLPMCVTDVTGVTPGSTAELNARVQQMWQYTLRKQLSNKPDPTK